MFAFICSRLSLVIFTSLCFSVHIRINVKPMLYRKRTNKEPTWDIIENARLYLFFLFAFLFPIRRNWLICSSVQLSKVNDLTFDMLWLGGPRTRLCTEAHLPHNNIPKVYEAQVGCEAPHSPHLLSLPLLLTASINCLSFSFCCFLLNIGKNGGSVGR